MTDLYADRGVSHGKEDVHRAIAKLDKGLYSDTFCKILPDLLADDPAWCNIVHADTAGTKASLAYLYWRETGDLSVWRGIVQDALVMNLDDMACAGATDRFVVSSTIGRNKRLIPADVLEALIGGTEELCENLRQLGVEIHLAGGETADVGDLVRTLDVGLTVATRFARDRVQHIDIRPGQVIVGVASFGRATYEQTYNSGIGSNGLTFARHEVLHPTYASKYPESFDPGLSPEVVYQGNLRLTDPTGVDGFDVGKLLLSPTRTYLPLLRQQFADKRPIHAILHDTGGGQTKVLHFAQGVRIIKDNLPPPPPVFQLIQSQRNMPWKELYQVFNMGVRLEVYTTPEAADSIRRDANALGLEAWVIGRVEDSGGPASVCLTCPTTRATYTYSAR